MIEPRLFSCSGHIVSANDPRLVGRKLVSLDSVSTGGDVNIQLEDVARVLGRHLPDRLVDLLEIASYIYTADSATRRGDAWDDAGATESWKRDMSFLIPVRDLSFWQQQEVNDLLVRTLTFLSSDQYSFEFVPLVRGRELQEYLNIGPDEDWPFYDIDRVVLFSGGLDSLAGTIELATAGQQVALVSHRAVATINRRQRNLFAHLQREFRGQLIHVPVWINKAKAHWREHTQRTRSFLFGSLGCVVAGSLRARGVRFYENGVVSLNLPVADEVLRARASRTTHPLTLNYCSQLFALVLGRELEVDNPYLFHTKADVVRVITDRGHGAFIAQSCSCAHTAGKPAHQWHCGTCSQCIDRRVAIQAAGAGQYDPEDDYAVDVFVGSRGDGYEKNMAVNYARHVDELAKMSPETMAASFNLEITRAVRPFKDQRGCADRLLDLHRRHALAAKTVFEQQLTAAIPALVEGSLPPSSLLALIAGGRHFTPTWHTFSERLHHVLSEGVPRACKTHKPKDEPHLQEVCDGILKGIDSDLVREYPFMRWSSSLTKPDWSSEYFNLWVELKYIRKPSDIRTATEDISSDITKYGDNAKYVLYVIYDPLHLVTDETMFRAPIESRPSMRVGFVR